MVDGFSREKMVDMGEASAGYVQGKDGASGGSVGKDGPYHESEGVIQGHRVVRGPVESMCISG